MGKPGEEWSEFVSASEAAKLKGVHRSSVHKAIASGRLPAQNVAGRFLIRRSDLDGWTVYGHRPKKSG
jgi:excisionase family DNA binding protein